MDDTPSFDILQVAFDKIKSWDDEEYNKQGSLILEEQPYLMRFITNLIDELEEEDIEFLIFTLISLQLGFKMRGMPLSICTPDQLESIVKITADRFDEIDEREEVSLDDVFNASNNPKVLSDLFDIYYQDFLEGKKVGMAEVMNMLFVLDILVTGVEESVIYGEKPSE